MMLFIAIIIIFVLLGVIISQQLRMAASPSLKSSLEKIRTHYRHILTTSDTGAQIIDPDLKRNSMGVKNIIDMFFVDQKVVKKEGFKRTMAPGDYERLYITDSDSHRWIFSTRELGELEHDGTLSGLHLSSALSESGLSVICPNEFAVGHPSLLVYPPNYKNKKCFTPTGSIDLICKDLDGNLVIADLKTLECKPKNEIDFFIVKEATAIQLHFYMYLLERMAKEAGVNLKIEYGVIIGYSNRTIPCKTGVWKVHRNMDKWMDSKGIESYRHPIVIEEEEQPEKDTK